MGHLHMPRGACVGSGCPVVYVCAVLERDCENSG
jgi:hypothetical protein